VLKFTQCAIVPRVSKNCKFPAQKLSHISVPATFVGCIHCTRLLMLGSIPAAIWYLNMTDRWTDD